METCLALCLVLASSGFIEAGNSNNILLCFRNKSATNMDVGNTNQLSRTYDTEPNHAKQTARNNSYWRLYTVPLA